VTPAGRARPATTQTGAQAEAAGQRYLELRGLRLVARNFRCRSGELDLVMLEGDQLVMVEVRYRARIDPVPPAITVTATKQRRLLRTASWFLVKQPRFRDHALRFDVLALSGPLETPRCDWYRGAFNADDVAAL
jgi:putative endonuclease